jgi:tRNA G18 (ribose-2'-O)-methylase SpoU
MCRILRHPRFSEESGVNVVEVADPSDGRLHDYTSLTDVALRRRREPAEGLFIAEGETVIGRALRAGYRPRSVLVSPKRLPTVPPEIGDDVPVYLAAPDVLASVTGFEVHRGALASMCRLPVPPASALLRGGARRLVVLEDLVSHTNLGAVFRSAAGLGLDGVLLSPRCADPLYRRCVRVSMGEVFAVPYARLEPWPAGVDEVRAAGFTVLALTPGPGSVPLDTVRPAPGDAVAILLGTEGTGLSPGALAAADQRVGIPMAAGVDSLNIAAAAAIAFYALRP